MRDHAPFFHCQYLLLPSKDGWKHVQKHILNTGQTHSDVPSKVCQALAAQSCVQVATSCFSYNAILMLFTWLRHLMGKLHVMHLVSSRDMEFLQIRCLAVSETRPFSGRSDPCNAVWELHVHLKVWVMTWGGIPLPWQSKIPWKPPYTNSYYCSGQEGMPMFLSDTSGER